MVSLSSHSVSHLPHERRYLKSKYHQQVVHELERLAVLAGEVVDFDIATARASANKRHDESIDAPLRDK